MKLYYVHATDNWEYVGTRATALSKAKALSQSEEGDVTVEVTTIVKLTKENMMDILNSSGGRCVESSELIATFRDGKKV